MFTGMYQSIRMIILMTRMIAGRAIILVPCIENSQYGRYFFLKIFDRKKEKRIPSGQPRLVRLLLQVMLLCEDRNPAEEKIRMMLG